MAWRGLHISNPARLTHRSRQIAVQGSFQQALQGRTYALLQVRVPVDSGAIPEISANKYALNIRFTVPETDLRPKQAEADVAFELTFCNL